MIKSEEKSNANGLLSLKTVIRTKDLKASINFYTKILNLNVVQKYNDGDGSKGVILRFGPESSNAFLEISEIKESHNYHQDSFDKSIKNDKIDIQLRTDDVEYWASKINGQWNMRGPVLRPWGSQYLYLRDPDGLQIIIYQEKS